MGFLAGQYILVIPRLLVHAAFLLSVLKNVFFWALRCVGLAEIFEPETSEHTENASGSLFSAEVIREHLPVAMFGEVSKRFCAVEEDFICAVCLCAFEADDEIRELCNCRHIFHRDCLDKWLDHDQNTCPLCRSSLMPEFDESEDNCHESPSWVVDRISYVFAEDLVPFAS
ncbi:hypothetical protein SUGI_1191030 [Cryptomeria japonica]|uniref:brassinosteroid-responsive RING protein 1 n=1 Tax=Cryptomeria japonica TaxID=3369 RepID=UPI002414A7A3|nr:brassinosteroid-responsive RING protein 1 [Cryptomeria japonica]GLJ55466.1 hypothetical protein SUGI_1191030 [Cryptomeria japonica]